MTFVVNINIRLVIVLGGGGGGEVMQVVAETSVIECARNQVTELLVTFLTKRFALN